MAITLDKYSDDVYIKAMINRKHMSKDMLWSIDTIVRIYFHALAPIEVCAEAIVAHLVIMSKKRA
jgi:hypothetical protein